MSKRQMAVSVEYIVEVQDVAPMYRFAIVVLKQLGVSHDYLVSGANKPKIYSAQMFSSRL
jgi:hypothetical protein